MKKGIVGFFNCYSYVTTLQSAIQRSAVLAGVMFLAGALDGRAQPVTLQTGYNFVGCSVNGSGGNSVNNNAFLQVPATLSDPNGTKNAVIYVWNCVGFNQYQYFTAADAAAYFLGPPVAGWYDNLGNLAPVIWNPGAGMIIQNFDPPATITFSGTPATPVFPPANYCGCNRWSLLCPQTTNAASTYQDVTGFAPQNGAQVSFGFPTNGAFYATDTYSNGVWSPNTPILTNNQAAFFWVPCSTNSTPCCPDTGGVKYLQPPDLVNGIDVNATFSPTDPINFLPWVLADDFPCTNSGPITDIHLWGSWLNDQVDANAVFTLAIWSDAPTSAANQFSHPDQLLWTQTYSNGQYALCPFTNKLENFVNGSMAGIPNQLGSSSNLFYLCFDASPTNTFYQTGTAAAPTNYWLSVTVQSAASTTPYYFGWKSSSVAYNDAAVSASSGNFYPLPTDWNPMTDSQGLQRNMAFKITTATNPCSLGITCPSNIVVSACTNVQVFYAPAVTNTCCGTNLTVTCSPLSGSYFAPGTTTPVFCQAVDCNGLSNSCAFTVTVQCNTNQPPCCPDTGGVKYLQPPNLVNGIDVNANFTPPDPFNGLPWVLADDFPCTNSGPITDIHIWGSWLYDQVDYNAVYTLAIWSDVPTNTANLFSHPGLRLWTQTYSNGQYAICPFTNKLENFYDGDSALSGVASLMGNSSNLFYLCFDASPTNTFVQMGTSIAPTNYWLSVTVQSVTGPVQHFFGWKSSSIAYNDAAVSAFNGNFYPVPADWYPMTDAQGLPLNLAFKITTATNSSSSNCCDNCVAPYPQSYNVTIPPGVNVFLANNLCQGTNNTLSALLSSVPNNTVVSIWNGSGYVNSTKHLGVWNPNFSLSPGQGFVLKTPAGTAPLNLTISGCPPMCPPPCAPATNVLSLVGSLGIGAAAWTNLFSCPPPCGAQMLFWNGTGYTEYDFYNQAWHDVNGNVVAAPLLAIGQSAFVSVQPNTNCCPLVINCPGGKTVPCGSIWSFDPPSATSCCTNYFVTSTGVVTNMLITPTSTLTNGTCPQYVTQTWLIMDGCGHSNVCSQVVTIVDTNPPTLICGSNKVIQCGANIVFDAPYVNDDCSGTNVTLTVITTGGGNSCSNFVRRTWVATDQCGNSNTCSQTIIILDTLPPTMTCASNKTVNCGSAWSFDTPGVQDNCGSVSLTFRTATNGICPQVITRTWTAVDSCGNSNTCSQTVTVVSCVPPPSGMVLWLPFDETSGTTSANLAGINNGTQFNGPTVNLGNYVANSLCFNGVNQYVEVPDYSAINIGTGNFSVDAWVKPATLDNTIRIIVDHRAETSSVVGYSLFLGGGNTIGFQIGDGPFVNYPSPFVVPADGQWHHVAVTVNRSQTNGIHFFLDGLVGALGRDPTPYSNSITPPSNYPFRVGSRSSTLSGFFPGCIDEVEVFNRELAVVEVQNLFNAGSAGKCKSPELVCATNKTVQCGITWSFDAPVATDPCNGANVVLAVLSTVTNGACPQVITRTWQLVDSCGRSNFCSQVVTVVDTNPPTITCSSNKTVLCGVGWSFDPPTASDSCSGTNVTISVVSTITNSLCPTVVTRTWKAADLCGNTSTCSQTVTVISCVPPPANMTLWLPLDETSGTTSVNLAGGNNGTQIGGPSVNLGSYVANSLCFNGISQYVDVPDYPGINPGTGDLSLDAWVLRSSSSGTSVRVIVDKRNVNTGVGYSLSVSFGNLIFTMSNTNFRDTGTVPADNQWHHVAVTLNRSSTTGGKFYIDGLPTGTFDPTVVSGSLSNTSSFEVARSPLGGNIPWLGCIDEVEFFLRALSPSEILAIYNAGTLGKCKSPTLVCATNKTVQCDTNWSFDPPVVIDPCNGASVSPIILSTLTNGTGHIIFTGGGTTASGVINIAAGAATSGYLNITAGSNVGAYTLSPGGGSNANFFWDGLVYPGADPFVDNAGLLFAGSGIEVNLYGNGPDNYSLVGGVGPSFSTFVTNGVATMSLCPEVITRTWLYVDACGHTNTCSQTVTVVDTTPPVINCPSNIVVTTCTNSGVVVNYTVTATDNCCANVTIGSTPPSGSLFHPGTTIVSCTATDCCGNVSTCSFTVTVNVVNDTTPPVFTTYCTTSHIVIGGNNFASPIAATPSSNLLARLNAAGIHTFKNFDECTVNTYFAHTFTNLPPCITAATLTLRLKPCGDNCGNDSVNLSFTGPGGILLPNSWGRYLGGGNPQTGLVSNNWCSYTGGQVFVLDLSALPQPSGPALNDIGSLNANGFLDLNMQDDSGIDYAILDIVSCCCATNKSVPFGTPWTFDQPSVYDAVWGTNITITSITYTSSICPLIVTRTWFATDPCGNTSTCSQTITVGSPPPCVVFNTGMSGVNGNVPVVAGSPDPNFTLLSWPAGGGTSCVVAGTLASVWLPNSTASQWIGPAYNSSSSPAGVYHYQLQFIMCCTNNAQMSGRLLVDDTAGIYLNGNPAGYAASYNNWTPVNINGGFVPGLNVLDIYVTNAVIWTGFRAELTNCAGGLYVSCSTNKTVECGSKWSFDLPVASSCCGSNISITVTANATTGVCPKIASRTWRITDGCGNTNFCTQTVTLRDTTPPIVTCPTNRIIVALDSNCMIRIPVIRPRAVDNCTPASQLIYVQNPPAGSVVSGPCTGVTITVKDLCGNAAQCQVQVCGQDKTPPKVTGPQTITVTNCIVPNVLPFLTLSDNCTPASLLHVTQSPLPGTPIAAGGNIVTVTVTDQAGNTTTYVISIINSGPNSFLSAMFNTGVNPSKAVLPSGSVDPHYTLGPVPAGTPTGPGYYIAPSAWVKAGFWGLPPFTISQWIAPGAVVDWSYPAGNYTYTNQFTLPSGGNPATASISGRWAADDGGKLYINGLAPANLVSTIPASYGFNHWTYFTINSGFLANPTVNTLYFVVSNSFFYSPSPTGLRVEFTNAVINCSTCTPPSITWITPNQSLPVNSAAAVFSANIWGTPPLNIQWYHNNTPLVNNGHYSGVNTATLTISPVGYADAGTYYVCVGNPCGGICSLQRKLTVTRGWWPWPWAWWNFAQIANPMAATFGPDLMLVGTNTFGISSGSTADFGLPNVGGQIANVINVQPLPTGTYIQLPFVAPPASNSVSSYTLLMDVYAPSNAAGPSTLFNIESWGDDSVKVVEASDGAMVVSGSVSGEAVNLTATTPMIAGTWNRVALVVSTPEGSMADGESSTVTVYINGEFSGIIWTGMPRVPVLPVPGLTIDWGLDTPATLLSSPPGTGSGAPAGSGTAGDVYVSSIQFHAVAMTPEMIAGLGGADTTPMPANDTSVGIQPVLSAAESNGVVNLSWTGSSFVLQEATDLTSGNWVDSALPFDETEVSGDILATAHANPATEGPAKFYRLIYAP